MVATMETEAAEATEYSVHAMVVEEMGETVDTTMMTMTTASIPASHTSPIQNIAKKMSGAKKHIHMHFLFLYLAVE
jgi:hypothetical protein